MEWTDERIVLLKRLWADGLSAAQIAKELGGVTRSAVIGKLHRLGATERTKGHKRSSNGVRAATPRKPRVRTKPVFNFGSLFGAYPSERPAKPYVPKANEIVTVAMPLLMLTDRRCKFAEGDGPFLFCGLPVKPGTPYCPGHAALCFTHIAARSRYTEKYVAYVAEVNAGPGAPVEVQAA